ncbi:MAG: hypothetical protein M1818_007713 [Claussenomyces sp. TS43310]|nr:MAG: hypothetical protein M1818_007713 [Claussenomyces sp. TS43310]
MSSWFQRATSSSQLQFAATAAVSGAVVAGAILGYQHVRRQERVEDLKSSIPALDRDHHAEKLTDFGAASPPVGLSKEDERSAALAARAQKGDYDEELINEQLARNRVFLTDEGLSKLRSSFIIVVGCGGVGSHCVSALARSGASHIRLIDFDQVSLSSLNRHAVATLADVGTPKVHCLRRRLQAVTPWTMFDCRNQLFNKRDADALLAPAILTDGEPRKPDFIVDAIDNIDSKVDLLAYCYQNNIKVISSMGAGCKSDPTRILVGDISSSTDDPLSRSTRRRLRAPPYNIASGIPVVYSTEKPGPGKAQLLPLPDDEFAKGKVNELAPMQDFRVRILPVLGTMPAIFGYTAANHVITQLAGYPTVLGEAKGRDKMYDSILAQLQAAEERLARTTTMASPKQQQQEPTGRGDFDAQGLRIPISAADVGYVVEEIWRGRSALSRLPTRLALVRWRRPRGPTVDVSVPGQKSGLLRLDDLVCMTKEEAAVHEREVLRGDRTPESMYDADVVALVEARLREEKGYERYR